MVFKRKRKETGVILFADIVQSSAIYKKAGDNAGHQFVNACIDLLIRIAFDSGGRVIKTIGDEVMCLFPGAPQATTAAVGMHTTLDRQQGICGLPTPNLYIGMHKGDVVIKKNDVFGQTVNIAAYLVKMAKPRQVLITRDVADDLEGTQTTLNFLYATPVKGAGTVEIYEYLWEIQDATVICNNMSTLRSVQKDASIELHCCEQALIISKDNPAVTIGRQRHNHMVIKDNNVSRTHARIEYRHGKIFLIDQSSNGTFVELANGSTLTLNNEEIALSGNGRISLGRSFSTSPSHMIRFRYENHGGIIDGSTGDHASD